MTSDRRRLFIQANKTISELYLRRGTSKFVYADLMHNNLEYLLRSLYIARSTAVITGCDLIGIAGNPGVVERSAYLDPKQFDFELAESFGVKQIIFAPAKSKHEACSVFEPILDPSSRCDTIGRASVETIRNLQNLQDQDGVQIGRIVQDTFMRSNLWPTVYECDALNSTREEIDTLSGWLRDIFRDRPPEAFVSGHIDYSPWGLAMQHCLAEGGKGIYYRCDVRTPIYVLGHRENKETLNGLLRRADERAFLEHRDISQISRTSIDIRHALNDSISKNWRWTTHPDAGDHFEWPFSTNLPTACLFSHTFTDQPSADESVFIDHLDWLEKTLAHAAARGDYNLLVKVHPLDGLFDLSKSIDRLENEFSIHKNIVFSRQPIPTSTIVDNCAVGITVRGTPGTEFSALGLTMLLAGRAYYDHVECVIRASSELEYFSYLEDILFSGIKPVDTVIAKEYVAFDRYWAAPFSSLLGSFSPNRDPELIWSNALSACPATAFEVDEITQCLSDAIDNCEKYGSARAVPRHANSLLLN